VPSLTWLVRACQDGALMIPGQKEKKKKVSKRMKVKLIRKKMKSSRVTLRPFSKHRCNRHTSNRNSAGKMALHCGRWA
jgi:hypothetical protein